ncbi:hypothetical protein BWI97_07915 [Siphonobacter sp. BAB-5405]|uniref:lipocalin family protein n=1 Tax=Siphonobacter sp. BAB-5405 TaxID=1864825 RepID=UPI000C808ADF|nr:lipocalin family protein [Siphonobacter sp. BAB-5405]PMD97542.1 hypothetical protein BWI97_07915 [Siphonobacter sp. BAB-5405]
MKPFIYVLLIISFIACKNKDADSLVGKWMTSGQNPEAWGFVLDKEGIATALPVKGVQYKTWEQVGSNLVLHGTKSEEPYTNSFKILSLKDNTLVVEDEDGRELTFTKTSAMNASDQDEEACYAYTMNQDTVFLHLTATRPRVTGDLTYQLHEKDANRGSIQGKMKGDTLLAEYTFNSEGRSSVREVVFIKKGETWVEGFGPVHDKEGKVVFQNHKDITFTNGLTLKKVNCVK